MFNNITSKHGLKLILFIALIVRLYHIDFPVGGFQSWRQADTAAIARNFYNNGFQLLYPEIDWGGGGVVESEFQIYPFITAILYKLFFPSDIWGRLLSIIFSMGTVAGLFMLVKIINQKTAFWSSLIFAVLPLNIFYTRVFMPESMMLMSSVWGIYFFFLYIQNEKNHYFILSAVFISLAILLKITTLYLGLPLFYIAWLKYKKGIFSNWKLWLYSFLVLLPPALWYYHAYQLYLQSGLSFGIWFFGRDKWGVAGPLFTFDFYNTIFFKSIAERHLTYGGFILFIIGLFIKRKSNEEKIFDWWLISLLIFFAIITVGNQVHEYYQLPFLLPASVYIGKSITMLFEGWIVVKNKLFNFPLKVIAIICLCILPVLSFLRVANFMNGENRDSPIFKLAESTQKKTAISDKIITVDDGNPLLLYLTKRKGWHGYSCLVTSDFLLEKKNLGASYLIGLKNDFTRKNCNDNLNELIKSGSIVEETSTYFIIRL